MLQQTRDLLLAWYHQNMRILPWRATNDPYFIWLSEIILQQTRVQQGLPYYLKFVNNYPTVRDLAAASEDEVLKVWQGLGYYSRARNLHATAIFVTEQLDGVFPNSYEGLLKLKGVGDYTASAIASFAFNQNVAVLDGNVFRVLARIFNVDKDIADASNRKYFKELANNFLDQQNASTFNQAIMEFGALQCTPAPNCFSCPIINYCQAYDANRVTELPVKLKKVKVTDVYLHYLVLRYKNEVFIKQRGANGIWKQLFEFILFETNSSEKNVNWPLNGITADDAVLIWKTKHKLTHRNLTVNFYQKTLETKEEKPSEGFWITADKIESYAIPRVIDKFLQTYPL